MELYIVYLDIFFFAYTTEFYASLTWIHSTKYFILQLLFNTYWFSFHMLFAVVTSPHIYIYIYICKHVQIYKHTFAKACLVIHQFTFCLFLSCQNYNCLKIEQSLWIHRNIYEVWTIVKNFTLCFHYSYCALLKLFLMWWKLTHHFFFALKEKTKFGINCILIKIINGKFTFSLENMKALFKYYEVFFLFSYPQ